MNLQSNLTSNNHRNPLGDELFLNKTDLIPAYIIARRPERCNSKRLVREITVLNTPQSFHV